MNKKNRPRISKLYSRILLWIDRRLAGRWYKQLFIAFIPFLFALLVITIIYSTVAFMGNKNGSFIENIPKAFVDMTNPETFRDSVYYKTTNQEFHEIAQSETTSKPSLDKPGLGVVFVLAIIYVLGAIAFTGLLVATITNIWRSRAEKFRRGKVDYRFSGHVVILGYNGLVPGMIQKICEEGNASIKDVRIVVGVENNASIVSEKIKNRLYNKYRDCVVVLQSDSCNMKDLERLRVTRAKEVYIIGEYDDAYNLRSYRTIYELSLCDKSTTARMPQCYVNLNSRATLTLFRTYASSGELGIDLSKFHSFSFYDEWARTLLIESEKNKPKEKKIFICGNRQNHFFIAGMTEMGIALALKAAMLCHHPINGKHTIITFIDEEIHSKSKQFIIQYQEFFNRCEYRIKTKKGEFRPQKEKSELLDIEFEFIEGNLTDDIIKHMICNSIGFKQQATTIALCYENPQQNLTMGLNLPDIVYEEKKGALVWIFQQTLGDLGNYLKNSCFKNVVTFGMLGENLDIRNGENTRRAKLINHYFLHKDDANIDYSNQYLIDTEWEGTNILERWACIRRSEFVPVLAQYINDSSKMKDMESLRSAVDNLLFPVLESDNPYSIQNDYSIYIETIKRFYVTDSFTFIKHKNDEKGQDY